MTEELKSCDKLIEKILAHGYFIEIFFDRKGKGYRATATFASDGRKMEQWNESRDKARSDITSLASGSVTTADLEADVE